MKKKRHTINRILRLIELPQDLNPHLLVVRWIGKTDLLIEQHRGILKYSDNLIRLLNEQGILMIKGHDLEIRRLAESSALICGEIQSIAFEDET